jgi:peptidoglycan hydrolase-like protein with peptidoglycan-binding domain
MSGHDVRVLQQYLTFSGFPTPIVGSFGPLTLRNVKRFERRYDLRRDGVVDARFVKLIRKIVADKTGVNTTASTNASTAGSSGGVGFGAGSPSGPIGKAKIVNGLAVAPAGAPAAIQGLIAAANKIAFKPYIYGGGHASWNASGYDCSGSVSYALHGGGLLNQTEDSSELESYGSPGAGKWVSIWANSGHVYMYVAGLRFDTSAQSSTGGSRWTTAGRSNVGYIERHPTGY